MFRAVGIVPPEEGSEGGESSAGSRTSMRRVLGGGFCVRDRMEV
jgi:hypothetical protein